MGISTYLVSLKVFAEPLQVTGLGPLLLSLSPLILTATALSLLFAAVPNCRVSIPHAIIGGLVTALVFEIAKQLFTRMVAFSSYELIYGAFAAIPLFLIWIYVSWLIVLAGAELVNALGTYDPRSRHQYGDITVSLGILQRLWEKHQNGEVLREDELLRQTWLFDHYTLSSDQWTPIRSRMLTAGLINISDSKDFMLGRDLHSYTLADLCNELGLLVKPASEPTEGAPEWFTKSQLLISNSYQHNQQALNVPLAELYETKAV
jgi:membrane protein